MGTFLPLSIWGSVPVKSNSTTPSFTVAAHSMRTGVS